MTLTAPCPPVCACPAGTHSADVEPEADLGDCDGCGRHRPIVAGIILLGTDDYGTEDLEPEDLGFCSEACMVIYVRQRWIEQR